MYVWLSKRSSGRDIINFLPLYCTDIGEKVLGKILIELATDFSSKCSEKTNSTFFKDKFVAPLEGIENNKVGGVLSFGPPGGAWIAAHE